MDNVTHAALGIAAHALDLHAEHFGLPPRPPRGATPRVPNLAEHLPRPWMRPGRDEIVCHCEGVTRAEIAAALERIADYAKNTAKRSIVLSQTAAPSSAIAGIDRLTKYYLQNFIGNPLESTIAMGKIIFGGELSSRMASARSSPVIPGIIQSRIIRSNVWLGRIMASACSPLSASVTL